MTNSILSALWRAAPGLLALGLLVVTAILGMDRAGAPAHSFRRESCDGDPVCAQANISRRDLRELARAASPGLAPAHRRNGVVVASGGRKAR
jgi:hypothetical protein